MGRYGHHDRHSRYEKRDHHSNRYDNSKQNKVKQDWDSSKDKIQEPEIEEHKGFVDKIKEKYQKYNSPDARMERKTKSIEKQKEKIENLEYKAKAEVLKANIRKARQTAPLFSFGNNSAISTRQSVSKHNSSQEGRIHIPATNYGSMDRMFGIGTKPAKLSKPKPSGWGNMDKLFGSG